MVTSRSLNLNQLWAIRLVKKIEIALIIIMGPALIGAYSTFVSHTAPVFITFHLVMIAGWLFGLASAVLAGYTAAGTSRPLNVKATETGVRIVAHPQIDPILAKLFACWSGFFLSMVFVMLLIIGRGETDTPFIEKPVGWICLGIAVVFLVCALWFHIEYRARQKYPGDIVFTPYGVSQRIGNVINEARWQDIKKEWRFKKSNNGEVAMYWQVVSDVAPRYRVGKEAKRFLYEKESEICLVLTPVVSDMRPLLITVTPSRYRDSFIKALSSPDREKLVKEMMTMDDTASVMWPRIP